MTKTPVSFVQRGTLIPLVTMPGGGVGIFIKGSDTQYSTVDSTGTIQNLQLAWTGEQNARDSNIAFLTGGGYAIARVSTASTYPMTLHYYYPDMTLKVQTVVLTSGDSAFPLVAPLQNEGVAVVWNERSSAVNTENLYINCYDGNAESMQTFPFLLTGQLYGWFAVISLANGYTVISWTETLDYITDTTKMQLLDSSCNFFGNIFTPGITGPYLQGQPLMPLSDGGYALFTSKASSTTAYVQKFDASGDVLTSPTPLPVSCNYYASPLLNNGGFLLVCPGKVESTIPSIDLYKFDNSFNFVATNVLPNPIANTQAYNTFSLISAQDLPDGSIIVCWEGYAADGSAYAVSAQRLSSSLAILNLNQVPNAAPIRITLPAGNSTLINFPSYCTDPDGDTVSIYSWLQPLSGSVNTYNSHTLSYSAPTYFTGSDQFNYTITDNNGGYASNVVTVLVTFVNHPPHAFNNNVIAYNNAPTLLNVTTSDYDPDPSDKFTLTSITTPSHGVASIQTGLVRYTANIGYQGADSLSYTITDTHGASASASVSITVKSQPVASIVTVSVNEESSITVNVLASASDSNGDALYLSALGTPAHGTALIHTGMAQYTPTPYYVGQDSFSYTVTDGTGGVASSSVLVTVLHIDHPPIAQNDLAYTNVGNSVLINALANDSDSDGDALTLSSVVPPAHGSASIQSNEVFYTPAASFYGIDSFNYLVIDGHGGNATATIFVHVLSLPIVLPTSVTLTEGSNQLINVLAGSSDPNGLTLSLSSVSTPAHGSAAIQSTEVLYTPNAYYYGGDSFNYTVTNGYGYATQLVNITINHLNVPPFVANLTVFTPVGVAVTIDALAQAIDYNNAAMQISATSTAEHGEVSISNAKIQYLPDASYHGHDSFNYTVSDAADKENVGEVVVYVNSPPAAGNVTALVGVNQAQAINVLASDSDPDGDSLTLTNVYPPHYGTAAIATNGEVVYTPNHDFNGTDSFIYTITDGYPNGVVNGSVNVLVNPAPTATPTPTEAAASSASLASFDSFVSSSTGIAIISVAAVAFVGLVVVTSVMVTKYCVSKKLKAKYTESLMQGVGLVGSTIALNNMATAADATAVYDQSEIGASITSGEDSLVGLFESQFANDTYVQDVWLA